MVKKAFLIACLGAGFAVVGMLSFVTQVPINDPQAAISVSQVDADALTLKARNLPIQILDDAI